VKSLNARRAFAAIALSVLAACGGGMPAGSPIPSGSATATASKGAPGKSAIPLPCRIQPARRRIMPAGHRVMQPACGGQMQMAVRR
jgi:hypothetical protein